MRFKPMPSHQRAFIHALAGDFGFDSESMDPEPHRHVYVFKTPRFVASPMKTLAECVRVRALANAAVVEAATEVQQRRMMVKNEPFNGFLLTGPRFALTIEELRGEFAAAFAGVKGVGFEISFLPSEHIVLKAHPASAASTIPPSSLEGMLKSLKPALVAVVNAKHLAASVHLVALDGSLNLLRREVDKSVDEEGWSTVAAKAAGPRFATSVQPVGGKSAFMVLGSKGREKKKKVEKVERQEVVEDWEEEMRREEEGVMKSAEMESKAMGEGAVEVDAGEEKGKEGLGGESFGEEVEEMEGPVVKDNTGDAASAEADTHAGPEGGIANVSAAAGSGTDSAAAPVVNEAHA